MTTMTTFALGIPEKGCYLLLISNLLLEILT